MDITKTYGGMKNMPTRTLLVVLTLSLLASPAFAQIGNVSVEGGVDIVSHYIFRGFGFTNKPTAQPSLTVGFGESGVSFNIWGSASLKQRSIQDAGDELDFTLTYDGNLGEQYEGVGFTAGYIQYTFPSAKKRERISGELFAGLSLDVPASPSVTLYRDFGLFDYWYLNGSIGHEVQLTPEGNVSLGVSGDIGYSDTTEKFEFNHVGASVSLSASHSLFSASATIGIIRWIEDINEGRDEQTQVWGGVSVGFAY
jgi:uncharacterized protein (TIGR02001 family)